MLLSLPYVKCIQNVSMSMFLFDSKSRLQAPFVWSVFGEDSLYDFLLLWFKAFFSA